MKMKKQNKNLQEDLVINFKYAIYSQSIVYFSTEDTSLRDFYIMTLYRTYGHASENTKLMLLPCGQRTMLQELRIVKEELTLILVHHVISTGHQILKLVLNITYICYDSFDVFL